MHVSSAQELSRKRTQTIPVTDEYVLDSLHIVSHSVKIFDQENNLIDTSKFEIDGVHGMIKWKEKVELDSVKIEYTTFPFNLSKSFLRKKIEDVPDEESFETNPFAYMPGKETTSGIDFGNIDYNGSFSRGLSFGNNQDVVLNSSLNLQLSGKITDDIEIVAALTDNNIPVQPDGNTQQIQEFDKVYIQVGNKKNTIILGDYDAQCFDRYFMRFYKRLQGGSYRGNFDLKNNGNITTQTSLAVARGKFTRNQLQINEGNQGPYRLVGAEGETFIIILAGTERVFINGQLKTRGADRDYIIDYNIGEITFMPGVIITRDIRVFVEFEYAVQNYFRTILFTANDFKINDKLKFHMNFYTEQDNKNQPTQDELTNEQKAVLRAAGDNLKETFYPGYRIEDFEPAKIFYKMTDTVVAGFLYDSVLVYSTNADSARYTVVFSNVGFGRGNYVRAQSSANGVVFAWLAPDAAGNRQGSYEPVRVLIAPKREQMLIGGMEWQPNDKNKLFIEAAMSNDDQNTFSERDNQDNIGAATRVNYQRKIFLNQSEKKDFFLLSETYYEFANRNFNPLERYRPVEFNRDWNFQTLEKADEHWGGTGISLVKENVGRIGYQFNTFQKGDHYKGFMNVVNGDMLYKNYYAKANIRIMNSETQDNLSLYIWPQIEAAKSFSKLRYWKVGGRFEKEDNRLYVPQSDSLLAGSFLFNDWRVFIANSDSATDKTRLEYIRRQEFFSREGTMDLATTSNTYNFTGEWLSVDWQQFRWRFTYRNFESHDTLFTTNAEEEFYLGRLEYTLNLLKGFINLNTLYELGSGREQQRTFSFLEVPAGQGVYQWIDYNDNGIQELNEFEPVPPGFEDRARFIKIYNPTNEFSPVNITTFNQSLNLNPRAKWFGKKGVLGFFARFSTLTSVQLNRKVFREAEVSPFNPFITDVSEEFLVSLNSLVRQSVFFNRASSVWGVEYSWQNNQNKTSLINGYEVRSVKDHLTRFRWNFAKSFSYIQKFSFGNKGNISELFGERNYDIRYYNVEPEFTFLYKSKFRATALYKFSMSDNLLGEVNEKARVHDITNELRYNIVGKSTINSRITYAKVNYVGAVGDNAIQFAMLQGLQDGQNFLWSISFERNLAANVLMSLTYEGRKTGDAGMVHNGRASVRAIF